MKAFTPCSALRDRVASITLVENDGGELTVLPSTGAVLGFQLRGRVRAGEGLLSTAGVTGIQSRARRYGYVGSTASILVRFTPQGASCLGVPASELASRSIPLAALLAEARAREVQERLLDVGTDRDRVAVVESLLLELPFARDRLVDRALAMLGVARDEDARVASVARSLDVSERQLERRFLARVGITPKRFASLRRFEHALALARTAPSLAAAALDAGYYDQAHFIRDARRFAGATPRELLRRA